MSINVDWDVEKKETLVLEFSGEWSWHECREAMQVVMYMNDGSEGSINHIYDLSESALTTRACLTHLQKLLKLELNPAPEKIIIVDKAFRVHMLEDMLVSITRSAQNIHFAEDLESARKLLLGNLR